MPTQQWMLLGAAILGFAGVAAGAFGAHALKQRVSPEMLAIFEVGVRYQMYYALALALWSVSQNINTFPSHWLDASGWSFLVGDNSLFPEACIC